MHHFKAFFAKLYFKFMLKYAKFKSKRSKNEKI
ncbi:hypothetical protein CUP0780 [Campylobacter upsaliensis RM3195]|nr:hypothetical protein CUP0780 [Campylobacter upsaliensis RM3195]